MSKEKNMTCKFQPVSVDAEEKQRAAGTPSIQRTSGKRPNETSMKDEDTSYPHKMAQDNKRVRLRKKIPVPPSPSKPAIRKPVSPRHREGLVPTIKAGYQRLEIGSMEVTENMLTLIKRIFLSHQQRPRC